MRVHASALKHGVAPEDAVQAAYWAQWIEPLEKDDWPQRELRLGFDTRARLLEVVVLTFGSGETLVIHAMPARKQYWTCCPDRRPAVPEFDDDVVRVAWGGAEHTLDLGGALRLLAMHF